MWCSFPSKQTKETDVHRIVIPFQRNENKNMSTTTNTNDINEHHRRPKKLIHCSDGVVEESSSDDEVDRAPENRHHESLVNEVKLQSR